MKNFVSAKVREDTEMINDLKTKIQELGGFMSGMVMPNIGALIAWGFVTSLFLETGYFPDM